MTPLTYVLLIIFPLVTYGQDTTFLKAGRNYEISAVKDGYHLVVYARYKGSVDTVFWYQYGGYLGVTIIDAIIYKNHFICVYQMDEIAVCKTHRYVDHQWVNSAGGIVFFFNRKYYKLDEFSLKKNVIRLQSGDRAFKYKINFDKNILERVWYKNGDEKKN